jgi:signal peptide peptidase SppA
MRIIDIINGPWAITPNMLEEIQRIYSSHLHRAEKIDIAAIEAATGKKLNNSQAGSYVVDGVAVIPMHGVIGKRMNLFTQISGGCSTEMVGNDYLSALNDPAVKGIVLHIDSPGGTVDGTKLLADLIASNRGAKPVISLADGMMCSAAYWIGSAADSINMVDLTTDVGSIGVVAAHMDISGWEEKQGIKTTEITAGKYKRAISQYQPLSDEGRAMIQADLDQIYGLFVDAVAANRGVGADEVVASMAEGRVFLGQKALDNGLVDSVATLAETIQQVNDLAAAKTTAGIKRASAARIENAKEQPMTIEQLKADHPDLVEAIAAEATAGHAAAIAAARAEGAAAEIDRIQSVRAQSIPGHEALIDQLAFDGTSTGADAALAIVSAEKSLRGSALQQLTEEAPPSVPAAESTGSEGKTMKRADFNRLPLDEQRSAVKAGIKLID